MTFIDNAHSYFVWYLVFQIAYQLSEGNQAILQ